MQEQITHQQDFDLDQIWTPLLSDEDIRILKLLPGHDEQVIDCTLEIINLKADQHHYQALSYTWGSLEREIEIKCNGITYSITKHLHSALCRLRDKANILYLWVDALCIDQSNDSKALRERGAQVQLMWQIFSKAGKVIVNLEEAVDRQEDFEEFLRPFRALPDHVRKDSELTIQNATDYGLPGLDHACWPILMQVLSQDYFRRVWIIQECVLATELEFLLGTARYAGDFLEIMLCARTYGAYLAVSFASSETCQSAVDRGGVDICLTNMAMILSTANAPNNPGRIQGFRNFWHSPNPSNSKALRRLKVLEELLICATYKTTDIRDRVYSLLGLLLWDGHQTVAVDYLEPVESVARRATLYLIEAGVGPTLLQNCNRCQRDGPSWMINLWQTSEDWLDKQLLVNRRSELFDACGSSNFRLRSSEDGLCLLTAAIVLDKVTIISPRIPDSGKDVFESRRVKSERILDISSWIETIASTGRPGVTLDTTHLWRTLSADMCDDGKRYDADADVSMLTGRWLSFARTSAGRSAIHDASFDVVNQMPRVVSTNSNPDKYDLGTAQVPLALSDVSEEDILSLQLFGGLVELISAGRRLALSESGLMAQLPGDTQLGDHLAIILGAPIPVVLRWTGDGFRLVGLCYIHHLMDGQVVDSPLWQPRNIKLY